MPKLFNFQKEGSLFLQLNKYALLADEMGVGKTPQLIDAAKGLKRGLIICPSVAKFNWQKEFLKFDNRKAYVAREGETFEEKPLKICSFEYATKFLERYKRFPLDFIGVDEGHMLKSPGAHRTKAILGSKGLLHCSDRLWVLTGTPAPNHAGELWVWLYTFGYTTLSYEGFVNRYCNTIMDGGPFGRLRILGSNTKHTPELKALLKKFMLRRLKKDVLDLPPIFHNSFAIEGDSDAAIFKQFPDLKAKVRDEFEELCEKLDFDSGPIDDNKLLNVLTLMSQSVSSLRRYHGLKKVRPVADIITQELKAQEYKKIVIFGIHKDVLETLTRIFIANGFGIVMATGKHTDRQKFEAQEQFQNDKDISIFVGNIQAAGTNLTLHAADQISFIEQSWVPGENKQAADRLHRMGQKETVSARHFCINNSVDDKITATLTRKIQEISTFID